MTRYSHVQFRRLETIPGIVEPVQSLTADGSRVVSIVRDDAAVVVTLRDMVVEMPFSSVSRAIVIKEVPSAAKKRA